MCYHSILPVAKCLYLILIAFLVVLYIVYFTGRMSVLILMSEGCSMQPVTLILPLTDSASSGLSVLIPPLPCNNVKNVAVIRLLSTLSKTDTHGRNSSGDPAPISLWYSYNYTKRKLLSWHILRSVRPWHWYTIRLIACGRMPMMAIWNPHMMIWGLQSPYITWWLYSHDGRLTRECCSLAIGSHSHCQSFQDLMPARKNELHTDANFFIPYTKTLLCSV